MWVTGGLAHVDSHMLATEARIACLARRYALAVPTIVCVPRTHALLRGLGVDVQESTSILGRVTIVGPRGCMKNLKMGVGCFIGPDVTFGLDAPITLGERVAISTGVVLSTATHMLGPGSRRMTLGTHAKPIVIEDGAWVALRAIILPGVHVGRGSVITAGSVVTSDVPRDTLVSGNPAVVIRSLPLGNR